MLCQLLCALLAAAPAADRPDPLRPASPPGQAEEEPAPDPAAELARLGDEAPSSVIRALAGKRDAAALDALLTAYDQRLQTLGARMDVLAALDVFDGFPELAPRAIAKLHEVATEAPEPELREVAIATLGAARQHGRRALQELVDSDEPVKVREQALRLLVAEVRPEDQPWYATLCAPPAAAGDKRRGAKDAPPPRPVPEGLRELAFGAAVGKLDLETLRAALADPSRRIREAALVEWNARDAEGAADLARAAFENREEHPEVRLAAAELLFQREGAEFAEEAIEEASRADVPARLCAGLADLVRANAEEQELAKLVKRYGKGKETELLFGLLVLRDVEDEKLEKGLLGLLDDRSLDVRTTAIGELARRGLTGAREDLVERLDECEDPYERAALVDALGVLGGAEEGWPERLRAIYSDDPHSAPRNAALAQLARGGLAANRALLESALVHQDRSTRVAAVGYVESARTRDSVALLVGALPAQEGRRIRRAFTDALWRLTGQPHRDSTDRWQRWWADAGEGFEPVSERELRELERESRTILLRSGTSAGTFFDVRIDSDAVIFVVDVSGSMEERVLTELPGTSSGAAGPMRIDVAKRELARAVAGLDELTEFNVITFSSDATVYRAGLQPATAEARAEAGAYIEKLGAFGGTNLYGALEAAFLDPEVDTIFLLSDGEPSVGDVVDPWRIRERAELWNRHRGVTVHSIAIGPALDVLRWLAEDSGGSFTHIP